MLREEQVLTEADVREALRVCFDPELRINVVDLGLVHAIGVEEDVDAPGTERRYRIRVVLLPRDTNEERDAMLVGLIANRLLGMRHISIADVAMAPEPAWTAERMSAAAREQLSQVRGLIRIQL